MVNFVFCFGKFSEILSEFVSELFPQIFVARSRGKTMKNRLSLLCKLSDLIHHEPPVVFAPLEHEILGSTPQVVECFAR